MTYRWYSGFQLIQREIFVHCQGHGASSDNSQTTVSRFDSMLTHKYGKRIAITKFSNLLAKVISS